MPVSVRVCQTVVQPIVWPRPTGEGSGDRAENGRVVVIDVWSVDLAAKYRELVA